MVVNEEAGFCCDHSDLIVAAEWIKSLAADPARLARIKARAKELGSERFSQDSILPAWDQILSEGIEEKGEVSNK